MVQLEEVKDQELDAPQPGPISDDFEDDADFTDTDSSLSDNDATALPPVDYESPLDRLIALQDMIPPTTRRRLSTTLTSLTSLTKTLGVWGGKSLYVISTSALVVLVPFALAYTEEQAIVEQEREIKAREGGVEAISPGAMVGGAGARAAL